MSIRCSLNSMVSCVFFLLIFLNCFPGFVLTSNVTLDSIEINNTHEWLKAKPTVYSLFKVAMKMILADGKKTDIEYAFEDEESWPKWLSLAELVVECNISYPHEREPCPTSFSTDLTGKCTQENKECTIAIRFWWSRSKTRASISSSGVHMGQKGIRLAMRILFALEAIAVVIVDGLALFEYWQKKKRQQDLAQFELTVFRYFLMNVREPQLPILWPLFFGDGDGLGFGHDLCLNAPYQLRRDPLWLLRRLFEDEDGFNLQLAYYPLSRYIAYQESGEHLLGLFEELFDTT